MNIGIELRFITGFMVGAEWIPIGEQDEELGWFILDLGIIRFLTIYCRG